MKTIGEITQNWYSYYLSNEYFKEISVEKLYDCPLGRNFKLNGVFSGSFYMETPDITEVCDEVYYDGPRLTAIQFYRTAQQVFAFCNKTFGTAYPSEFYWPWRSECRGDEFTDYNSRDFHTFTDRNFPLKFTKSKMRNEDEWEMHHDLWGGFGGFGYHKKDFYICLADGMLKFIREHENDK